MKRETLAGKGEGLGTPTYGSRYGVHGTVLAFDYGERYIGVAVGEKSVGVAHPLTTLDAPDTRRRFASIAALVAAWRPACLVVGLPLGPEGERHALTGHVERFVHRLEGRFGLPVARVDERLSSVEASARRRALGRGGRKHKALDHTLAAQVILQDYFEAAVPRYAER